MRSAVFPPEIRRVHVEITSGRSLLAARLLAARAGYPRVAKKGIERGEFSRRQFAETARFPAVLRAEALHCQRHTGERHDCGADIDRAYRGRVLFSRATLPTAWADARSVHAPFPLGEPSLNICKQKGNGLSRRYDPAIAGLSRRSFQRRRSRFEERIA